MRENFIRGCGNKLKIWGIAFAVSFAASFAVSFAAPSQAAENGDENEKIVINIAGRSLALYKDDEKIRLYPIGPGKITTPTPTGYYKILFKEVNPTWIDPGDERHKIPSGKHNPLGYRWMQFHKNYGIHGTNKPESIGNFVSNGCIRMFEQDVEALFDLVKVGTPVEITYNRVVVEKIADNTVVYYIYPDGYNTQPLTVADVEKWLTPYGVMPFISAENIAEKIKAADGQATYIGKVYNIMVDDKRVDGKAVRIEDILYVPVLPLAQALNIETVIRNGEGVIATNFGDATYYEKKGVYYINADDTDVLFKLDGFVTKNGVLNLNSPPKAEKPAAQTAKPVKTREIEPTEKIIIRTEQDVKQEAKDEARAAKQREAAERKAAIAAAQAKKTAPNAKADAAPNADAKNDDAPMPNDDANAASTPNSNDSDNDNAAPAPSAVTDPALAAVPPAENNVAADDGEQAEEVNRGEVPDDDAFSPPERRRARIGMRERQVN